MTNPEGRIPHWVVPLLVYAALTAWLFRAIFPAPTLSI